MPGLMTIYDHIAANNRKTVMLVLLFPLSLIFLVGIACELAVFIVREREIIVDGLVLLLDIFPASASLIKPENEIFLAGIGYFIYTIIPIFILAGLWMLIAYRQGDSMILWLTDAVPVTKHQEPKVYRMVENVAKMAGLPMPLLYVIEEDELNAYATGRNPENSAIVLTRGIINGLRPLELEGVIAHEMAHIGNRDIRLNMLIIAGLGIFGLAAGILRMLCRNRFSSRNKVIFFFQLLLILVILALVIFNAVIAPFIQLAVSRSREYAADAAGALITRNPQALASALLKIAQNSQASALNRVPLLSAACIVSPLTGSNTADSLTRTHPSIANRVKRLNAMSGLVM